MNLKEIKENLYELDNETHLKKTKDGFRLIYPIRDPAGKFNLKNLLIGGKWSNFFLILFVVSLMLYLSWGYKADMNAWEEYVDKNCQALDPFGELSNFPNFSSISSFQVDGDDKLGLFIPSTNNDAILQ